MNCWPLSRVEQSRREADAELVGVAQAVGADVAVGAEQLHEIEVGRRRVEHRQVVLVAERHVQVQKRGSSVCRRCPREPDARSKIRPPSTLSDRRGAARRVVGAPRRPCRRADRPCSASSQPARGRCRRRAAASGSRARRPRASRCDAILVVVREVADLQVEAELQARPAGRESRVQGELRQQRVRPQLGRDADVVDRLEVLRAQHRQPVLREIGEAGRAVEVGDARAVRARGRSPRTRRCR